MPLTGLGNRRSSYKDSTPPLVRKKEIVNIREKFPNKIPCIVERASREKVLPALEKVKYLTPSEMTMGSFTSVIRNRMCVGSSYAIYFTVNRKFIVNMSSTMAEVYTEHQDDDGYLYITYSSQEVFGGGTNMTS